MEYLLRNVLAMGRGSVDFAKKLLEQRNAPPSPTSPSNNKPDWCTCKLCRPMPSDQGNVCCKRVNCMTRFQVFNNICLGRDILEMRIKAHCNIRADQFHFLIKSVRNSTYLQFIQDALDSFDKETHLWLHHVQFYLFGKLVVPWMAITWDTEVTILGVMYTIMCTAKDSINNKGFELSFLG